MQREALTKTVTNLWTTEHVAGKANRPVSRVRIDALSIYLYIFLYFVVTVN